MDNIDELKFLLNKVKLINFKYEKILKSNEYDFNIFTILRNYYDEVNLHSRFIYEILNPDGTHHKEYVFLKLFLESVGISDFVMEKISVKREYKNIDICITNSNQAIVIENKIFAGDQDRQLERYYEIMKQEGFHNIKVIYLTLSGYEPSDYSIGSLKENNKNIILTVSYENNIDNWIEKCIKEVACFPILRETFVQYQILIQNITGKCHSKGYIMEIKELLLMDEKNIRLATDISQALTDARIEIQFAFWEELSSSLKERGYTIKDDDICSKNNVESYYKTSRNNKYYGINFDLLNISAGEKLQFRIEIDCNIYYGFRVKRDGVNNNSQMEAKYGALFDIIKEVGNFTRNEWWLGWRFTNRDFNFRNFNNENVFALTDALKRKEYVDELACEIHHTINRYKEKSADMKIYDSVCG